MVSIRNYLTILILMLMVFVMFMFAGISSDILSDTSTNSRALDKHDWNVADAITAHSLNLDTNRPPAASDKGRGVYNLKQKQRIAILTEGTDAAVSPVLVEWCVYNKYPYRKFSTLPSPDVMEDYHVILFGDYDISAGDLDLLYQYADMGKTMIFTQLPEYQQIKGNRRLAEFFGIRTGVSERVIADGIKIFEGFMINKERIYQEDDYFGDKDDTKISIPYYLLLPGYEVYSVGILENQDELEIDDTDLPPLLWRTTTRGSFVYAVNSDIFEGMPLLGVLTAFMSRQGEYYVYPIVNAQTISLVNYPYFSDENSKTMQRLYSRSGEAVGRDLLWPNIIQVLKNYGGSYSFFASSQLDYRDEVGPKEDFLKFYLRGIARLPGDMGLSLGQLSKSDLGHIVNENSAFFQEKLPSYHFTALYSAGFSTEEVRRRLNQGFLENISLVMSDYKEGEEVIGFLDDAVLSVRFNQDGYQHETMDDIRMITLLNALGMCNVKVDIGRVFFPESNRDEWNNLSLRWSKGDTYFKDFSMLDMVSIYEMEKRVKRFLELDYTYTYDRDEIRINIDHFDEEAFFILSTNSRTIDRTENCTAEEITPFMYLIKASDSDVKIYMIEEHVLGKPKNNKTVPSTPLRLPKEEQL